MYHYQPQQHHHRHRQDTSSAYHGASYAPPRMPEIKAHGTPPRHCRQQWYTRSTKQVATPASFHRVIFTDGEARRIARHRPSEQQQYRSAGTRIQKDAQAKARQWPPESTRQKYRTAQRANAAPHAAGRGWGAGGGSVGRAAWRVIR